MKLNIQMFGGRGASSSKTKQSKQSQSVEDRFPIPDNISKMQKSRLESIRSSVLDTLYGSTKDSYEIKEFDVRVSESEVRKNTKFVSVSIETGLKGDEGTLASSLARNRALIFIGKNGGMKHAQWGSTKNKTTKYLYQAFADYRS